MSSEPRDRRHAMPTDAPRDGERRRSGEPVGDGYEARGLLGSGGMGRVDLVRQLRWDHLVAVKRPHPGLWDTSAADRLLDEARVWVELPPHPNLCACHYVSVIGGEPWIVIEYVAGGSLAEAAPTGPEALLDAAVQIAWGLAAAHTAGVAHRDVKPSNVLVDPYGTVKVTDFGLAAAVGQPVPGRATAEVTDVGLTPLFASPEQAAGNRTGVATDVWSYAVTVLALYCGRVEWGRGSDRARLLALLCDGRVPSAVSTVLSTCLDVDPAARPGIADVADRLRSAHQAVFGSPHPRPVPDGAAYRADGLNNKALSWLELGDPARAHRYWEQALRLDPRHFDTLYNSHLARWRAGRCTDEAVVAALEPLTRHGTAADRERAATLLAGVHLERGDVLAASAHWTGVRPESAPAIAVPSLPNPVTALAVGPDGQTCVGHEDGTVRWQPPGTTGIGHLRYGHGGRVTSVTCLPGRTPAASAGVDGTVRLWHRRSRRSRVLTGHAHPVLALTASPDGQHLVSIDTGGEVRRWALRTRRCRDVIALPVAVATAAFTPDAEHVVIAAGDGSVGWWKLSTGTCRWTAPGRAGAVAATNDRAAWTDGMTVRLWTGDGRALGALHGHGGRVGAITLDGDDVWSWAQDRTIRHWELNGSRCLCTWPAPTTHLTAITTGPDRIPFCGYADGSARLGPLSSSWLRVPAAAAYSRARTAVEVGEDADRRCREISMIAEGRTERSPTTAHGRRR